MSPRIKQIDIHRNWIERYKDYPEDRQARRLNIDLLKQVMD